MNETRHITLIPSQPVLLIDAVRVAEMQQNTSFITFGLIQSCHEEVIYGTAGEHTNQYTSDVVVL